MAASFGWLQTPEAATRRPRRAQTVIDDVSTEHVTSYDDAIAQCRLRPRPARPAPPRPALATRSLGPEVRRTPSWPRSWANFSLV
jgi:hypothetical protein